jgi:hypothetical protein
MLVPGFVLVVGAARFDFLLDLCVALLLAMLVYLLFLLVRGVWAGLRGK